MSGSDRPDGSVLEFDTGVIEEVFGARSEIAHRYAELLASEGIDFGLLGPREGPRIWKRHVLNSAAVGELISRHASVIDVGSGAGLPGIPLAICRPDLTVTLLEPMQRRVDFLRRSVARLGLDPQVSVVRGRADDPAVRAQLDRVEVVTARAVAPLARLVRWCQPLLAEDGVLLALKGESAASELERDQRSLRGVGLRGSVRTVSTAAGVVTVVEARRA